MINYQLFLNCSNKISKIITFKLQLTTRVESLETVIDSIKEFIEKETGNTTDHNPIDRRDPGNVVFVTFSSHY